MWVFFLCISVTVSRSVCLLLVIFSRQCGWGGLPVGKLLHLKGREPCFHWLQKVGQEVDGASHACKQEVTR